MNTDPNFLPLVLRYVQISSATAKKALDALGSREQAEKRAAAQLPDTLATMLAAGTVPASQKQAAEKMLGDHAGCLQLLKNAAAKIAEQQAELTKKGAATASASLGQGVNDDVSKEAGDGDNSLNASLSNPFVGQRTSEKKASDHKLFAGLGLSS